MVTFAKLKECYDIAKQNISTPNKRIIFTREEFIQKIGCKPEDLEAVCAIKRFAQCRSKREERVPFETIERIVNTCNPDEVSVSYHDGAFYRLYTEYISVFEIVDVSE